MLNLQPIISRMAFNADVLVELLQGVSSEQAVWRPAADKWSILEVINHLADEEVEDFRKRLRLTLTAPHEQWPPIDPESWVSLREYSTRALHESLERFLTEREASLRWLTSLESPDWDQTHVHPTYGPFRAGDLLFSWLEHDFIHIRQMLRLHREFFRRQGSNYQTAYAGEW